MAGQFKYKLGINELTSKDDRLWQALIGEFLGNLILNFFACGACTQSTEDGLFKAFAFGFGVYMAVTIVGHASGGHVNPAVTFGMLAAGRISIMRSLLYIVCQCLGAMAGTTAIKILLNEAYHHGLGHTTLAPKVTPLQGLGIEFFLGLLLVLTVFGACDVNKPDSRFTAPLAIGMAVTLGHLGTIHYTGASMNPARTFGTAFATDIWDDHWVYWAGPIIGGITAALFYTQFLEQPRTIIITESADKYRTSSDKYRSAADDRELRKLDSDRDYP